MLHIALSNLDNDELFTFSVRVEDHIDDVDTDALGFKMYSDNFISSAHAYHESSEKQSVSAKAVAAVDSLRDGFYVALRIDIRNNIKYHPDLKLRQDGKLLLNILNKDGKQIYAERNSVETAALIRIIAEFDANWLSVLDELGSRKWYDFMKLAQADYEKVNKIHTEKTAESKKTASATNSRKPLEDAIHDLFGFLPLHYKMTKAPELAELIGKLKVVIDQF